MKTVRKSSAPMARPPGIPIAVKAPPGPARVSRPRLHSPISAGAPSAATKTR